MFTHLCLSRSAFEHNIKILHTYTHGQKLFPVLKSQGYGHGLKEMGILCQDNDLVEGVCVVSYTEAYALRASGFKKQILVLYALEADFFTAAQYGITLSIASEAMVDKMLKALEHSSVPLRIHIEIDTGLSRSGFAYNNAYESIIKLFTYPHITVTGMYTHMITAESNELVIKQKNRLYALYQRLYAHGYVIPELHYANSGTLIIHKAFNSTLVRPGLATYGMYASDDIFQKLKNDQKSIKNIMRLSAPLVEIRTIQSGETVGYDSMFRAQQQTQVGLIPLGYGDGYPRSLSNKAVVRINNQYAPVIGLVGMNFLMIDVTHIRANLLDEVVLVDDDPTISLTTLATLAHMSPYECATGFAVYQHRRIID